MKKRFIIYLLIFIIATGVAYKLAPGRARVYPVQAQYSNIIMLPSSVDVDLNISNAVANSLDAEAARLDIYNFAITNVDYQAPYYTVSVAGFPFLDDPMAWSLDQAIWLGTVSILADDGMPATVNNLYDAPIYTTPEYGYGGSGNILPFKNGTTATYGILGVHDCGFGLTGWKSVDLFPTVDMVYSSLAGEVNYICRDGTQIAIRIGNNLYDHIVDSGQQAGASYAQGEPIGSMVPGTFQARCGNATQQSNDRHVHFCFVPNGNYFQADGYTLDMSTNPALWTKGSEQVAPLQQLTANWALATGISDSQVGAPTGGSNFWDYMVDGLIAAVSRVIPQLPQHQAQGIATKVNGVIATPLKVVYTLLLVNFDMTLMIWVVGIIFAMELVRIIYAGWMFVKRAIPVIG